MRATEGPARRLAVAAGWTMVAGVVALSVLPDLPHTGIEQGDKYGHTFAYALLMLWFGSLYRAAVHRLLYALGFAAMGVALEYVQGWLGYRSFDLMDMGANGLGVALALLVLTLRSLLNRRPA